MVRLAFAFRDCRHLVALTVQDKAQLGYPASGSRPKNRSTGNSLMTSAPRESASASASNYSELVLKTMPPRVSRHQLSRPRLGLEQERLQAHAVLLVQTPPGFGKTSLLAQWRREALAGGAAVAWITADDSADPRRFLHCLVLAVRACCGRPSFGRLLLESAAGQPGELEGITGWLAEIAQSTLDLMLIVDEAERLSPSNLSALSYLLHNLPPNLRVAVGARSHIDAAVADLLDYGQCLALSSEDLRFQLGETIAAAQRRFGARIDADMAARLHQATEGWPLGLQIMMSAMQRSGDPRAAIGALGIGYRGQGEIFLRVLLANLAHEDRDFLIRISVVDLLHPELCRALTERDDAPQRLSRLVRDTAIFAVADDSEWCRLHTLARDALRERLAKLPQHEQTMLHMRSLHWMAQRGMIEEAARHAHAAGQHQMAYEMAEQCLYDAVTQGHQETVLGWLKLLPEAEVQKRARLRLAAAWALALSERPEEAENLVRDLLENPEVDTALRYECALIASGAAYYADDPDRYIALFSPWTAAPPPRDPRLAQMHANRMAAMAIMQGEPAQARNYLKAAAVVDAGGAYRYGARWADFIAGLSYVWEGQVQLSEGVLRHALADADAELGRRHPLSCMIAALQATAAYEQDRLEAASELLANRLDVLERAGAPETVLLGYRTAARIAAAQGMEHRALDLLDALHAAGQVRRLPRLCLASLVEQVRIHAGRYRSETCRSLLARLDETIAANLASKGALWQRAVQIPRWLAHAYAAIAAQDWRDAATALAHAGPAAEALKMGRWRIETMALRAYVGERLGGDGRVLLLEAVNLAQAFGLARIFADAHPALADRVQDLAAEEDGQARRAPPSRPLRVPLARSGAAPRAVPSMVLTPKERMVLEYLARHLSNKEIAQAMEIGEETVKWHLKNLFGKLDAGTRKHAVRRAQLLGLLEGVE
jgi:LuxR family maltose regulon positive regulatory protein